MMIIALDGLLEEKESIDSQIAFCHHMAITTAKNGDRDISQIYVHIATNLMKLTEKSPPQKETIDDISRINQGTSDRMDKVPEQDGQHAAGNGEGTGEPQKEECPRIRHQHP